MRKRTKTALIASVGLLLGIASYWIIGRLPTVISDPDLGTLHLYPAWLHERGMVYLFSDAGWTEADAQAAVRFARAGQFAVGIDTQRLLTRLDSGTDCVYLPGSLEGFSRDRQRKAAISAYQEPALLGHGMGATLVYLAQVQAPPLSFNAAVARDPTPELPLRQAFCNLTPAAKSLRSQTVKVEPPNDAVPLLMWADSMAASGSRNFVARANDKHAPSFVSNGSLYEGYAAALDRIGAAAPSSTVSDLPLVEVEPAQSTRSEFAIIYSGDGGWRDLDQTLAGILADKGMPVVGVDMLRYYWHEVTPDRGAADLARIVRYYQSRWHRKQVVLIGFSLGADVLPFLVNRLPADVRDDVRLISLLSPSRTTAFEVDPTNWLGYQSTRGEHPIEPEFKLLPKKVVQCIYGADESDDSLCTLPVARGMQVLRKPGGHHFDYQYDKLADEILVAASQK